MKHKRIYILVAIITVAVVIFVFSGTDKIKYSNGGQVDPSANEEAKVPEVATDPSFKEIKGVLFEEFPEFPVYPGATLVGSAKTEDESMPEQGYRIKWKTKDTTVSQVMKWYQIELPKTGWRFEAPNDPAAQGEQVAQVSKGSLTGQLKVELEDPQEEETEILVDLKEQK